MFVLSLFVVLAALFLTVVNSRSANSHPVGGQLLHRLSSLAGEAFSTSHSKRSEPAETTPSQPAETKAG